MLQGHRQGTERRSHNRWSIPYLEGTAWWISGADSGRAVALDISRSGLCVANNRMLPRGRNIDLELDIGGDKFKARGVVARADEHHMGIRFTHTDPKLSAELATLD